MKERIMRVLLSGWLLGITSCMPAEECDSATPDVMEKAPAASYDSVYFWKSYHQPQSRLLGKDQLFLPYYYEGSPPTNSALPELPWLGQPLIRVNSESGFIYILGSY